MDARKIKYEVKQFIGKAVLFVIGYPVFFLMWLVSRAVKAVDYLWTKWDDR